MWSSYWRTVSGMEIQERQPVLTGLQPQEPSGPRRSHLAKRLLIGVVAGSVVLGGVLVLLPSTPRAAAPRPAAGPPGRANTAVTAGVPVAVADLVAVIGDREAHLRAHPRDGQAWAVLGNAYAEQARRTGMPAYYPKAEKALRASLRSRPEKNQAAMDGLTALANARGDFLAAKEWGETAVEQSPKRWTTYALLIDTYTGLGDYKAARRTLEKLQELHKGPRVLARASRVYWNLGWREDAAATISDAAAGAATPAERAAYLQQAGELAWERGDVKESLSYYKAALASDPDEHGSLAGQGRALAALGRMSEAMRSYQTALARQPAPRYALELGELYEKLGLTGAARVQYDLLRDRVRQDEAGVWTTSWSSGSSRRTTVTRRRRCGGCAPSGRRSPVFPSRTRSAGRCTGPGTTRKRSSSPRRPWTGSTEAACAARCTRTTGARSNANWTSSARPAATWPRPSRSTRTSRRSSPPRPRRP